MWTASVVTNDPLVGANPEKETFYGFHPDPGYSHARSRLLKVSRLEKLRRID